MLIACWLDAGSLHHWSVVLPFLDVDLQQHDLLLGLVPGVFFHPYCLQDVSWPNGAIAM